jgi:hypothetical protein
MKVWCVVLLILTSKYALSNLTSRSTPSLVSTCSVVNDFRRLNERFVQLSSPHQLLIRIGQNHVNGLIESNIVFPTQMLQKLGSVQALMVADTTTQNGALVGQDNV